MTRIRKIGLILRLPWHIFPDGLRETGVLLRQFETLRFVDKDKHESEGWWPFFGSYRNPGTGVTT
jgi:hypothetical protein